jgi:hypothetical protein
VPLVPYEGFIGGAYTARSTNFDAETCLNLYPETAVVGSAKSVAALYGTPGLQLWATPAGTNGVRGMIRFNSSTAFVVVGDTVSRLAADGSSVVIGLVTNGNNPVSMASNGINVVIATNPDMFIIDPILNTVTAVVDPDFLGAGQVSFLSGYFVWNVPNTGRTQYSNLYSTDIEPLSFFTAEASPDNGVGSIVDHLEYWYFNETTTEVYTITSDPDQPLQRIQGAVIEHGCAAAYSIAKMDNTIYWLGADDNGRGTVWRATGAYEPQRVSTPAIEYAISQTADLSGAVAWTYQQESHPFYVLNVGDRTWCFDPSVGLWHERAWRDPADGTLHRHRAQCQMAFANKTIVGDWASNKLYVLDLNTYTDNGDQIVSRRTGAFVSARTYNMLQVDFETGVGTVTGDGSDPVALLEWSDDGGKNWSNNHSASIGKVGEYQLRVRWRRLGTPRRFGLSRVFRVTVTDPVKRVMTGAMLDISA